MSKEITFSTIPKKMKTNYEEDIVANQWYQAIKERGTKPSHSTSMKPYKKSAQLLAQALRTRSFIQISTAPYSVAFFKTKSLSFNAKSQHI